MSRPSKRPVLIVTGDLSPLGGMDAGNLALADYLARSGEFEVHVVAHNVCSNFREREPIVFHRVTKLFGSNLLSAPLLDRAGRRWGNKILSTGGRVIVNGGNCDVRDVNWVHYVHAAYATTMTGSTARKLHHESGRNYFMSTERERVPPSRIVIVNSERTRRDLQERLGVTNDKIKTVYYGCDPSRFEVVADSAKKEARRKLGLSLSTPLALFVGALGDRRKGFDLLFDAWGELCKRPAWDVNLMVVGAGSELDAWRTRTNSAGLQDRIVFLGFRDDVPELMKTADVLIHPARYEAYGLAVQEALCTGIPALVSRDAGVAERYGTDLYELLIPTPLKADGVADRMSHWRQNAAELKRRVAILSENLRRYTWDDMASAIAKLL